MTDRTQTTLEGEVLKIVRGLLKFPYPQICRHLVAAELLGALDDCGTVVSQDLITATWEARDGLALTLLEERPA